MRQCVCEQMYGFLTSTFSLFGPGSKTKMSLMCEYSRKVSVTMSSAESGLFVDMRFTAAVRTKSSLSNKHYCSLMI